MSLELIDLCRSDDEVRVEDGGGGGSVISISSTSVPPTPAPAPARARGRPSRKRAAPPRYAESHHARTRGLACEHAPRRRRRVPEPRSTEHDDACFLCGEGGVLLCCDDCPRACHLGCHVPPLDAVPAGRWQCGACARAKEAAAPPPPSPRRAPRDVPLEGEDLLLGRDIHVPDDLSAASSVTLPWPAAGGESSGDDDQSDGGAAAAPNPREECHVCASHALCRRRVEELLGEATATDLSERGADPAVADFARLVTRVQVVLRGLRDEGDDGTSVFYHACGGAAAPDPVATVARLVQLFGRLCHVVAALPGRCQGTAEDGRALARRLFRPWRKEKTPAFPEDCGLVPQMLHVATSEILNSRADDFAPPEDPDRLLGVTFGLQLLQSMARNVYADARAAGLHDFEGRPSARRACVRRRCRARGNRQLATCDACGARQHRRCFDARDDAREGEGTRCPPCDAAAQLLAAARAGDRAAVHSLVVRRGASPLQPLQLGAARGEETALHAAVRANDYDLASMLLYGCFLLLSSHGGLRGWDLPEIAWGRDGRGHTPFQCGVNTIVTNMNDRPPVETLLLLCNRGARQAPEDVQDALRKRCRMLVVLKDLENERALFQSDISMGLEPEAVPVAGSMKDVPSYVYVAKSVESRNTAIRWFDCRSGKGRQLVPFEGECSAGNLKILHQKQGLPSSWKSYCNYLCPHRKGQRKGVVGGKMCECQLAEEGLHHKLEVFETSDGRGLGVRVRKGERIKEDDIICHYVGEIITAREAERRDREYATTEGSYLLDMDEQGRHCLDATRCRSVAAFVNHACAGANCRLFRALGPHLDPRFPRLGLRARRDVAGPAELTFDYGEAPEGACARCGGEHCLCPACACPVGGRAE